MADTNVYGGGIPNQGFNGTYPSASGSETMYKPNAGPAEVGTEAGSPANGSGKSVDGGFVMNAGEAYSGPSDMEPGAMKVIDLDDIKSTV